VRKAQIKDRSLSSWRKTERDFYIHSCLLLVCSRFFFCEPTKTKQRSRYYWISCI